MHVGPVVDSSFLVRSLEHVATLEPDLILLTGDFMTCHGDEYVADALEVLRALPPAPLGRLAVLGNHDFGDYWKQEAAADKLVRGMERLDIRTLRNETTDVRGLQVAGIDDLWSGDFKPERALAGVDASRPLVTLCHNPDAVDDARWATFTAGRCAATRTAGNASRLFSRRRACLCTTATMWPASTAWTATGGCTSIADWATWNACG